MPNSGSLARALTGCQCTCLCAVAPEMEHVLARLNLSLLGSPIVLLDGAEVTIGRTKGVALLAYLAVTRHPTTRDLLATLLWPQDGTKEAYTYLRQMLWQINKVLGKSWLTIDRERIGLTWQSELWVDVQVYQQRLQAMAAMAPAHGQLAAMLEAAELYQGDLLTGFTLNDCPEFEQWLLMERTILRQAQSDLLAAIVAQLSQAQEVAQAIAYARRLLKLEPLNEAAHRQLMQLYRWSDQRALALRQYQECVQLLAKDLNAPPDAATTALYQAILHERPSPLAPPPANSSPPPPMPATWPAAPPQRGFVDPTRVQPPTPLVTAPPATLPTPITPFLGRERELVQIHSLLSDPACRLVTLIGPGGIGKTRLALAAAQWIEEWGVGSGDFSVASTTLNPSSANGKLQFTDGVFFVPLADVVAPERLATTIAGGLQFTLYRRDEEPLQQLLHYLADKRLLLVLDNFEHLLAGAAVVTALLAHAPGVKALITSRERLNVQGEWLLEVSGLAYAHDAPLAHMADYSAVQLFVQSARRVNAGFVLNEENRAVVARICGLVEGLPLALELAAAWLRVLPCDEIAAEIEQSLAILTATQRDLPARHRSIRALFDYSWALLTADERAAMQRLAVFRGGFRREAAAAVATAPLPMLVALTDKSLLRSDGAGRFSMHELLRQFATEILATEPAAAEAIQHRHLTYYTTWLQQQHAHLHRRQQKRVLGEILAELENVRAAWRRALQQQEGDAIAAALDTLADFYELCGWFHEGEAVFAEAVTALPKGADEQRLHLLGRLQARLGFFAQRLAKYTSAKQLLQRAYAELQTLGDLVATSFCLNCLGELARIEGDYGEAERCLKESIALCQRHGDQQLLSRAYNGLGIVCGVRGRHPEAQQLFRDSLALAEAGEEQLGIAKALNNLGIMAYFAGDYGAAQRFYQRSLAINQDLGHQYDTALALSNLGLVAQKQGNYVDAVALFEECIALQRKIGYELGVGLSLRNLCFTLLELQESDEAATHLREVLQLAQKIRNVPLGLSGLVGLAQLYSLRRDWPTAVRLATFVHHHPATEDEIRTKAADLLVTARAHLASDHLPDLSSAPPDSDLWPMVSAMIGAALP